MFNHLLLFIASKSQKLFNLPFKSSLTLVLCLHTDFTVWRCCQHNNFCWGPGSLSEPETEWLLEITYSDITIENWCFNCRNFKYLNIQKQNKMESPPTQKTKWLRSTFAVSALRVTQLHNIYFIFKLPLIYYKMNFEHTAVYSFT